MDKKLVDIQYVIDDDAHAKTVSFVPTNTLKQLKNIIEISTELNMDDYDFFYNNVKQINDQKKLSDIINNKVKHPKFYLKSRSKLFYIL